jgi:glycosyltransferase involved in cell wall biosynthesis
MVTVYIPVKNLARYVRFAIDSVLMQIYQDFELILIDDGSTDGTLQVMEEYDWDTRIRIIRFDKSKGLPYAANTALKLATGKYIVRLDGDDILDENALMVMATFLDARQDVGLVYPDYYKIDSEGRVGEIVRREKLHEEWCSFDKAPHGACTMFRTDILRQLQGYDTGFTCQDGLAMWLKFVDHYNPYNINIPLFYYRKHGISLSYDVSHVAKERTKIKKEKVDETRVFGVIMASQKSIYPKSGALEDLNGKPLIDYTIRAAKESALTHIVISTPDRAVKEYVDSQFHQHGLLVLDRPPVDNYFLNPSVVAIDAMKQYNCVSTEFDSICILYANVPLRKAHHIDEAIYSKYIFKFDTVISVEEDHSFYYTKGKEGLVPVGRMSRQIRLDREVLFRENGAVYVTDVEWLEMGAIVGGKVGYTVMPAEASIKINSAYEHWLAEQLLRRDDAVSSR